MSKEAFTPGPWEWWTSCSWKRLTSKPDGRWSQDGNVLCPTICSDKHPDCNVSEADMALIAAAPDLYEALAIARGQLRDEANPYCDCAGCEAVRAADAALAKARGE